MADLPELKRMVEEVGGPDRGLDHELFIELEWTGQGDYRMPPLYTADLNAALALVERALPTSGPISLTIAGSAQCVIDSVYACDPPLAQAFGKTPPLAVLSALLAALASQTPQPIGIGPGRKWSEAECEANSKASQTQPIGGG